MKDYSLESVWNMSDMKGGVRVRFNDWTHQIRWFEIHGETSDGHCLRGELDNGEKITYSKQSKGWIEYYNEAEYSAHAV